MLRPLSLVGHAYSGRDQFNVVSGLDFRLAPRGESCDLTLPNDNSGGVQQSPCCGLIATMSNRSFPSPYGRGTEGEGYL
jgi:hypothetical protein